MCVCSDWVQGLYALLCTATMRKVDVDYSALQPHLVGALVQQLSGPRARMHTIAVLDSLILLHGFLMAPCPLTFDIQQEFVSHGAMPVRACAILGAIFREARCLTNAV